MAEILKKGTVFATLFGLYHFFIFCKIEEIPFPLELSVLPTLLSSLGILCILISMLVMIYATLSIFILVDPFDTDYENLIFRSTYKPIDGTKWALFTNYMVFFVFTPTITLVALLAEAENAVTLVITSLVLIPLLFVYYVNSPTKRIWKLQWRIECTLKKFAQTVATFFYINLFSLISGYVAISYFAFALDISSNFAILALFFVVYFLNFFIFVPPSKNSIVSEIEGEGKANKLVKAISRYPAVYIYLVLFVISLFPEVSHKTSQAAFRMLNMGGGIERTYYYAENARIVLPPNLISSCERNYCYTIPLKVILNLGGELYVEHSNELYSLPSDKLFIGNQQTAVKVGQQP